MIRSVRLFDDVDFYGSAVAPFLEDGRPFTGIAVVPALVGGWVAELIEVKDGFENGYFIEMHDPDLLRTVAMMRHGRRHGLVAEWGIDGRLISAERYDLDHATECLEIDGVTNARRIVSVAKNAQEIERARRLWPSAPAPIEKSVLELLDDFDIQFAALLEEARRGLSPA